MQFPAKKWMDDLRSAIMFITVIPAGTVKQYSPKTMIRWFPIVGLFIGFGLLVWDSAISMFWPPGVAAVLDVVFLAAITGALHLDGLGDAADGLFSHRPRERALEIMKDSRTGMMGIVVIVLTLAIKVSGIYAMKISGSAIETLILFLIIPSFSRSSMLVGIRVLPYGRGEEGIGHGFFEEGLAPKEFYGLIFPVILSVVLGLKGVLLLAVLTGSIFLILGFYKRKLGCITGDMLGAMTELTEALLFLAAGSGIQ